MQLVNAILSIDCDDRWQVWAKPINGELKPESAATWVQRGIDYNEALEGMIFVCNGETAVNHIRECTDSRGNLEVNWFKDLIDPVNKIQSWAEARQESLIPIKE